MQCPLGTGSVARTRTAAPVGLQTASVGCAICSAAKSHRCTKVAPHHTLSCCMRNHCVPSAYCTPFHTAACIHNVQRGLAVRSVQNMMVMQQRVKLVQSKAAAGLAPIDLHLSCALPVQQALPCRARCRAGALWGRKWSPTLRADGGCQTLSFWHSWRSAPCRPMCLEDRQSALLQPCTSG